MNPIKIAAIIPARMASSRYPGKPLIEIEGLPMVEHVRRRALLCPEFTDVIVATCDREIRDAVEKFGGKVLMTSDKHVMASDRVAEAAESLDCSHIVNVQGDEILVIPDDLRKMAQALMKNPDTPYWNAVAPVENKDELTDTAVVKCVLSQSGRILYCARDFSHLHLKNEYEPIRKVLGILGYRRENLMAYRDLQRTPLEVSQSIDQSRIIEHDIALQSVPFRSGYPGINDHREEQFVRLILKTDPLQQAILAVYLMQKD